VLKLGVIVDDEFSDCVLLKLEYREVGLVCVFQVSA